LVDLLAQQVREEKEVRLENQVVLDLLER